MDKESRIKIILEMLNKATEKQVERIYYFIKRFLD